MILCSTGCLARMRIAIIGAGMAGLSAANRLREAGMEPVHALALHPPPRAHRTRGADDGNATAFAAGGGEIHPGSVLANLLEGMAADGAAGVASIPGGAGCRSRNSSSVTVWAPPRSRVNPQPSVLGVE